MTADEFVRSYEDALSTQDWSLVEPLIHADACVTFSTGTVHKGKPAVQAAYERNFAAIEGDSYRISNPHWVVRRDAVSVYVFDFDWSGRIEGRQASGSGHGTAVIIREADAWKLIAEHLGP